MRIPRPTWTIVKRLLYPGLNLGVRSRIQIRRCLIREEGTITLDVGCGNGFFTALAVKCGGTAIGVSPDEEEIRRCREFLPLIGIPDDRLSFKVMSIDEVSLLGQRFDQILLLETLEHLDDDDAALRNVAGLLKPGGLLHVTTPDIRNGRFVGALDRHARGGHCRLGYTAERLETLMRAAGLDVVHQGKLGTVGDFLAPLQNWIAATLGGSLWAQASAFLIVYPLYVAVSWYPIPRGWRMFQYVIGRKRVTASS